MSKSICGFMSKTYLKFVWVFQKNIYQNIINIVIFIWRSHQIGISMLKGNLIVDPSFKLRIGIHLNKFPSHKFFVWCLGLFRTIPNRWTTSLISYVVCLGTQIGRNIYPMFLSQRTVCDGTCDPWFGSLTHPLLCCRFPKWSCRTQQSSSSKSWWRWISHRDSWWLESSRFSFDRLTYVPFRPAIATLTYWSQNYSNYCQCICLVHCSVAYVEYVFLNCSLFKDLPRFLLEVHVTLFSLFWKCIFVSLKHAVISL